MKYVDGSGAERFYSPRLDVIQRAEERADVSLFAALVEAQEVDKKNAPGVLMRGVFGKTKTLASLLYESLPESVRAETSYNDWCAQWRYADFMAIMDKVISATFESMVDDTAPASTGGGEGKKDR